MAQDLKAGQFWRDIVNGDVLRLMEFSEYQTDAGMKLYAHCACYPRGEYFLGIQEMQAAHFQKERFQRIGWFKSLWYKLKLRRSQPLA